MTEARTHSITAQDLLRLGGDRIAYIKPGSRQDEIFFYVFAADGTPLMEAPSREIAEAALLQQGLAPLSVH